MKFRIRVTYDDAETEEERLEAAWWETYDKSDVDDAGAWARDTIESFNATLRPHERPRRLLDVEVLDRETDPEHDWEKTSLRMRRHPQSGRLYDTYRCGDCGVTGRSYQLGRVELDPRYRRAKVYQRCDTAKAHLAEHGHPQKRR